MSFQPKINATRAKRCSAFFIALWVLGCAAPSQKSITWDVTEWRGGPMRLTTESVTHTIIDAQDAAAMMAVKRSVERAAGLSGYRLLLIDSEAPNAMAGSHNGRLFVGLTLPMVRALSGDQDAMAHLIGHEFAHHVLNHYAARKERDTNQELASSVLGAALRIAGVPMGNTIATVGTQMVATAYTRDEEREADALGFRYARTAGYDPRGGERLFKKLEAIAPTSSLTFLSTHPSGPERMETLRKMANEAR